MKDKFLQQINNWIDHPKGERTKWDHATDVIIWVLIVLMATAFWWVRHAPDLGLWPFN